jgi:tetratricopeptide (TPR) repeat protein
MNLFEMVYADDAVSLACLIAIFYIIGTNMADATVRPWGWRAAAVSYAIFVLYACINLGPTRAADLAYIAFRGLFAGGLAVGTAWMILAFVTFFVRELQNVEQRIVVSPALPQPVPGGRDGHQAGKRSIAWKPRIRDLSKLSPEELQRFQKRRRIIEGHEREARRLIEVLSKPAAPAPVAPTNAERSRLQTQLDELQLARQFFATSGEPPQQVGRMLAECDAQVTHLVQALGRIPADPLALVGPPQLMGRAIYDEAIARRPDNPALYVERAGRLIFQERDYGKAIADCNHALRLLPGYYAALNSRGCAHHCQGKLSAAVRDFERAIYDYPAYDRTYINLASTYNAAGAYREAIGPATYASAANPQGQQQLAFAYEQLREHKKAVHHLTKLIQCDPSGEHFPGARVRRARQLQHIGLVDLAMHDLRTHLARQPDDAARQLLAQLESLTNFNRQGPGTATSHNDAQAAESRPSTVGA